ncbi:MAG TPA: hypothetical protein VFD99_06535 [Arthrobacter sp.]|jgi:hypothetical protein|nr:hypothetical protein [Arthrobacter sp.]
MRFRIYSPAITALAFLALFASSAAAAPTLSKPVARKAAVAKMNRFLASHSWARGGKVGRCERKAARKVLCQIGLSGADRTCRGAIATWRVKRKSRARLGGLSCKRLLVPPQRFVRLAAHLGQPQRDIEDPYSATFPYTASAGSVDTEVSATAIAEPAALPEGVLAFYSDGILECALNVGGVVVGDECQVGYEELGRHRATTIYTSGSESAVATELHDIEPLATATTLEVGYQPLDQGYETSKGWRIGTLVITGNLDPSGAGVLRLLCMGEADCLAMPASELGGYPALDPTVEVPVYGQCEPQSIPIPEGPTVVPCQQVKVDPLPDGSSSVEVEWWPASDFVAGSRVLRAASLLHAGAGYLDSEARTAVQFVPELRGTFCKPEYSGPWC